MYACMIMGLNPPSNGLALFEINTLSVTGTNIVLYVYNVRLQCAVEYVYNCVLCELVKASKPIKIPQFVNLVVPPLLTTALDKVIVN